jgi:hypothetical protein
MRKDLVDELEKEARERGISTSALMNQTVDHCVNLVWPSNKTGALVIARDIVQSILNLLPAEEIRKIGALAAQGHKSTAMILMGTQQNFDAVLNMLDVHYGKNSRWFKLSHDVNGRDHRILLNHELGIKWSCFLEAYMRSFFMEMLDIPVKSSYTDNAVVLEYKA